MEEQKLLTERRRSIDADINSNRELKRYHEDCMEDITDQVYSLHGISVDKLEGIKRVQECPVSRRSIHRVLHICDNGCDCGICLRTDLTAVPVYTHVCRRGGSIVVPKAKEYTVFHTAYTDSGGDDWL